MVSRVLADILDHGSCDGASLRSGVPRGRRAAAPGQGSSRGMRHRPPNTRHTSLLPSKPAGDSPIRGCHQVLLALQRHSARIEPNPMAVRTANDERRGERRAPELNTPTHSAVPLGIGTPPDWHRLVHRRERGALGTTSHSHENRAIHFPPCSLNVLYLLAPSRQDKTGTKRE